MRAPIETETFGDSSNQAIFMVSTWAMPKEVMHDFALRLSERFYVVLANLPGISLDEQWIVRSRIGPNYDIDALSEQLIAIAPKRAWWIGWSLGGMISVYIAARRSSCVEGVITLSALPSFVQREGWPNAMSLDDFEEFASLVKDAPEKGLKRFVMLQSKGAEDVASLADRLCSFLPITTLNPAALTGGLRLLKSLDVRRELSVLDLPNLHILGGKDVLIPTQELGAQSYVNPLQEIAVLSDCAHQPFLENENECVRYVEHFIDVNS